MGVTAMIPNMTFQQLKDEATAKWGEIWDPTADRLEILLLCPRKERKLLELHGDMIDHGQPVMGIFHRPRGAEELLAEQGFDHRDASFQFINIANSDMGIWMQQLVTQEGWLRSTVEIHPTPFAVGIPNQRAFEKHSILCFRHPSLPNLDRYFLPYPVFALVGKAFVSLPRRQAAELARQQAEILGVGLAKPEPEIVEVRVVEPKPVVEESNVVDEMEKAFIEEMKPEPESVPLPAETPTEESANDSIVEEVTVSEDAKPVLEEDGVSNEEPIPLPESQPEESDMPEIEKEFRDLVSELLAQGVDPSEMMTDERMEDINERALAQNFETWPVFMQMVS